MRLRTLVSGLFCITATAALAQDGGYVRFPSNSPEACATACASDQMCASWSYGTSARSYGQNTARAAGGMCTFSNSSVVRNVPGMVSGLPRRDNLGPSVPTMTAPPSPSNQSYAPQGYNQPNYGQPAQPSNTASGWGVRPAPWLANAGSGQTVPPSAPVIASPMRENGAPQILRPVPPLPSATPSPVPSAPRIEYEAPRSPPPPPPVYTRPEIAAPVSAPAPARPVAPVYMPPPVAVAPSAPPIQAPRIAAPTIATPPVRNLPVPTPPPGTQEVPSGAVIRPEIPAPAAAVATPRPPARAARGTPKNRATPARPAAPVAVAAPSAPVAEAMTPPSPMVPPPQAASSEAQIALPTRRPPTAARGTPKAKASNAARPQPPAVATAAPASDTTPPTAAPPRQEVAARPAPARGTPRRPAKDPNDPESFRGADGMIDAAEMRRAQLNAARDQGTPAYSVQREWEAVEEERQRAEAAGEVRVDPLAGTVPVAPPPETRAQRRAREAEEAAAVAEQARDEARAALGTTSEPDGAAQSQAQRPRTRGARGAPRPKAPRAASSSSNRPAPPQALDREPRLSGGPG